MPYKDPEKQRKFQQEYYAANKERWQDRPRDKDAEREYYQARRQANRDRVNEIKESTPCADCGLPYPYYVMDFDHLGDKTAAISRMVSQGQSMTKIEAEIAKCDLVCANCHRARTYIRTQGHKVTGAHHATEAGDAPNSCTTAAGTS